MSPAAAPADRTALGWFLHGSGTHRILWAGMDPNAISRDTLAGAASEPLQPDPGCPQGCGTHTSLEMQCFTSLTSKIFPLPNLRAPPSV